MTDVRVRAGVSDGAGRTEVRRLGLGSAVSRIRVESSAVCGTDVMLHEYGLERPAILGHHTIGIVDHVTSSDAEALGISVGSRVAVEEYVGCGDCAECIAGDYRLCAAVDLWTGGERVGMIPVDRGSGLHGGNAQYMEIGPRHALHQLPNHLSREMAAWTLPLANAVDWTLHAGGVGQGKTVAVIGPGYHGLACVAAALAAGAKTVVAVGSASESSAVRLGYASQMGAEIEVNDAGLADRIRQSVGTVDTVVDTVGSSSTSAAALAVLGRFGVLVVAGLSGADGSLNPTSIVRNLITVRGVRGRSPKAVTEAIELLAQGRTRLECIPTKLVALEEVESTLSAMHRGEGPFSPHVVIDPWLIGGDSQLPDIKGK